jgi:glutathione-regulated potassium-efflux system protein KefB
MQSIGLSMGLGAFLAGVVLADSEYRHELEADIEPFKGLLLGLFFISVGMTVDFGLLGERTRAVAVGVAVLLVLKSGILYGLGKMAKLGTESSLNMAVTISQGGEFAFVLFALGVQYRILDPSVSSLLILIVTISMAATPLLVGINDKILSPRLRPANRPFDTVPMSENPVLIAGYGRMGQIPARILKVKGFDFTALEHDPEHVSVVLKYGVKIYYGDASRLDLLEAAGAKHAKIFILAIDDVESSLKTAEIVRQHFPHLKIFARARNRQHAHELMDLGISLIYRETFATSLEMTRDVLKTLGLAPEHAEETIRKFRQHDEKMLSEQYQHHRDEQALINFSKRSTEQLVELFRSDQADPK